MITPPILTREQYLAFLDGKPIPTAIPVPSSSPSSSSAPPVPTAPFGPAPASQELPKSTNIKGKEEKEKEKKVSSSSSSPTAAKTAKPTRPAKKEEEDKDDGEDMAMNMAMDEEVHENAQEEDGGVSFFFSHPRQTNSLPSESL